MTVLVGADADQRAGSRIDDVVDSLAQRGPGCDDLEGPDQPGLLSTLELCGIVPG